MTLHRSVMFVPADNPRALKKAASLVADWLILDLEDAVAPENKTSARDAALAFVAENAEKNVIVRCNGLDSPWYGDDIDALASSAVKAVLIPKVDGPSAILAAEQRLVDGGNQTAQLWAMIETPLGVLHADDIASSSPRLQGFMAGLEDLRTSLRAVKTVERSTVSFALQRLLLAARAYGMVAIDSPYAAFKDADGLAQQCQQAHDLGFDGKACIHPSQLEVVNAAFSPSSTEVEAAHAILDAWDAALADGKSVATLNGAMVEELHVRDAARIVQSHVEAGSVAPK